jgi:hydrogenase maturation factor HypE
MKQTAVEYFLSEISKTNYKDIKELIEKSKEMEKDQIKRFALSLILEITQKYKCDLSEMNFTKNFDDYYKRYQDI